MLRFGIPLVLIVSVLAWQSALAKAPAKLGPGDQGVVRDSGEINRDPLGGIIINRTMTVLGWDFYKSFSERWQTLYPDSKFTITIYERATPQYGSEMWVSYRDQRVFHTFLAPARSGVKDAAKDAVAIAYKNIVNLNIQLRLFKSPDLGPEEM